MKTVITYFLLWVPLSLVAQPWELVKKVSHHNIDLCTLDQAGNIYATNFQGTVSKYSNEGNLILEYSPLQVASIHEITTSSQLKVTLFYKDLQELVILSRYLSSPITYRLSDFNLGYVEDVAPNFQQTLWVLDISDFSIKLIDPGTNRLLERKSLAQVLDQHQTEILSFHAHQNRMYIIDKSSGVLVFDNIGNYLFKLLSEAPLSVGFDKDYMYYEKDGFLNLIHLYEGENVKRNLGDIKFSKMVYSNDRLIAITPHGFNIYKYLSQQ
ncbi:hypothetical protein SAMN04488029_1553 [Reichenbachiella faecimaris]|uniref:Uncharacterized protein n=1 Tax=Reichenbachiella faecimaris TaxID=692418 RepID=A0A1W2G957_REIFA|nr:hypothetical protein [Reichenbachiella faecimaris]SMD33197.1 hypothetical protein SAMN04488029_1553 [Reichenbachiella faecimaris]